MSKKDKNKDKMMQEEREMDQMVEQQERRGEEPEHDPAEPTEDPESVQEHEEGQQLEGAPPESIEEKYGALQKDYNELRDKYLRLYAEFDNYKKRTIREKMEMLNTAARDTMAALLPVLDDFDRAKKIAEDENTSETFSKGVQLVYNKLYKVLQQRGLEPMETDGQVFDPELHEAFTEISAPSEDMKGHVVDTIEKGYKLKDKIIRHAKVVVGK
jgi:molecular chaperone GrpE